MKFLAPTTIPKCLDITITDCARYLCGYILYAAKESEDGLCARLSSMKLRKLFGYRRYKQVLDLLLNNGILVKVSEYWKGGKGRGKGQCAGYYLTPEALATLQIFPCTYKNLEEKVAGTYKRKRTAYKDEVREFIYQCGLKLRIDLEGCNRCKKNDDDMKAARRVRDNWKISARAEKGGRYSSPLANLPRYLREFVTTKNGEKLFALDVKNAQIVFLLADYRKWCAERGKTVNAHFEEFALRGLFYDFLAEKAALEPSIVAAILEGLERKERRKAWKKKFLAYCEEERQIDPTFKMPVVRKQSKHKKEQQKRLNNLKRKASRRMVGLQKDQEFRNRTKLTRNDIKAVIFGWLFGNPRNFKRAKKLTATLAICELVYACWPELREFTESRKQGGYELLAHRMQQAESDWLVAVVRRIMVEIPDAIIWTAHDSIFAQAEHLDRIKAFMQEEFQKLGLFTPAIDDERERSMVAGVA